MGARTTRITREEFLTPPEFQDFAPTGHQAARVGGACIELVPRGGRTRLGARFQQVPLRFFPPHTDPTEPAALLYLINPTGGMMDGDAHLVEITARQGSRAVVAGQSASRIHPALASHSTQQFRVTVEDDAILVVLPGPAIPFQGARYYQRVRVELATKARLIWGDVWLPGRYDRGELSERFQFERIVQDMEVRREGRLIFRDRFRWDGPWSEDQARWYFGGELATANLFVAGPTPEVDSLPPPPAGVMRSIFPLDDHATCVRWCGHPTPVTADLAMLAFRIAGFWTDGPGGRPWLVESGGLAGNHWFSPPETPASPPPVQSQGD